MKDFKRKSLILVNTLCFGLLSALPLLLPTPSSAAVTRPAIRNYYCGAGGFTGTIQVHFLQPFPGYANYIHYVYYKIDKGRNSGGNKANVTWSDGGTLPRTIFYTGDSGIQDNRYHYLGGNYRRGSGGTGARFIFDKSLSGDPSCTINVRF